MTTTITTSQDRRRIAALLALGNRTIASIPCRVLIVSRTLTPDGVTVFGTRREAWNTYPDEPTLLIVDELAACSAIL